MPEIEFTPSEPLEWVLQTAGPPPDDEPYTLVRKKLKAKVLEMEDVHFHLNSAVLLPDYKDCHEAADDQAAEDRITGLAVVQVCLNQAKETPDKSILVVGHTDTSGQDEYNLHLSDLRAKAMHALLSGNRDGFVTVCLAKSKVEDIQRIFKWAAAERGWDCDPGEVDNATGPNTRNATKAFQREYNEDFEKEISVDPVVGKQTWGAIFDVYNEAIAKLLETDKAGLEAMQKSLVFVEPAAIGAGEKYPIESSRKGDYRADKNRRVEILFFDPGEAPEPVGSTGDCGLCQILYDPTQYEYEHLPCEPKTPPTLLKAYLELQFMDADGNPKPFPEKFPLTAKYGNDTLYSFFTKEEGKAEFAVRRSGETFTLDFSSEEPKFLAQSAPAEEGGEPPPPVCVDPSALFAMAPTTQYIGFPKTWDLSTSKWKVEGADTYNTGAFTFEGLADTATKIGTPDAPVKLTLEIRWEFFQFVFYDRQAKKLSACPLQLEMRGWLDGANADPEAPDTRCRWASGQSQVLAWMQEKGTTETLISMHTEEGTFVKTADDGTQTLEVGLELNEANVERMRFYDLPQVWRSKGYWARLSAGSPDQAPSKEGVWTDMWETGTADGTPMMFFLDDIVLTDKDLAPIEWKGDGDKPNRIAMFCNTFDDQGSGPAGSTFSKTGLFNPDPDLGCYSTDPTDICDRNYIATYPYWTRLVATQGNLHHCFDKRVPDGAEGAGARAAVRLVDAPAKLKPEANISAPKDEHLLKSEFFAHQPFFCVEGPLSRSHQRPSDRHPGNVVREWQTPYQGPTSWNFTGGRYDMALIRCCDVVDGKEVAVNLWFYRMHHDFKPTNNNDGWIPTTLAEGDQDPFSRDACVNVCERWNSAPDTQYGHPMRFEPAGDDVPLVVKPLWYMQFVPVDLAHFKISVYDPAAGKRAWMSDTRGVGAITLEGNPGAWASGRTDVDAGPGAAYTMAHETGHAGSLNDEYNERWTEFSHHRLSYTSWIPGDPWQTDHYSMLNGNREPRVRHFWHAAEWCRVAMDDVGLIIKRKNGGLAGPAEYEYALPAHPRAPHRSYAAWPLLSAAKVSTDSHSRFHAVVYPVGQEKFAYEAGGNTGDPFDGILCVKINMRWNLVMDLMPIAFATLTDILKNCSLSVHKTFNRKFVASGFKLGETEFKRCLVHVTCRFAVENIPDDNDAYINGHVDFSVPTLDPGDVGDQAAEDKHEADRTKYIEVTLPPKWKQALDAREHHFPTDVYVDATEDIDAGKSMWGISRASRPKLELSLHDPEEDFYRWFGEMLGFGAKWHEKLNGSRDGAHMTKCLTDVILRAVSPDGTVSKL